MPPDFYYFSCYFSHWLSRTKYYISLLWFTGSSSQYTSDVIILHQHSWIICLTVLCLFFALQIRPPLIHPKSSSSTTRNTVVTAPSWPASMVAQMVGCTPMPKPLTWNINVSQWVCRLRNVFITSPFIESSIPTAPKLS